MPHSALLTLALLLLPTPALAYLDPGTGSVFMQILLGGLAGLAVAGKLFWQRITGFFRFGSRGRDGDNES